MPASEYSIDNFARELTDNEAAAYAEAHILAGDKFLAQWEPGDENAEGEYEFFVDDVISPYFGVNRDFIQKHLTEAGERPVRMYINSPGGSVFEANSIAHALVRHPHPVTAVADGMVASGATHIALHADSREAYPDAVFVFHKSMVSMFRARKPDMDRAMKLLDHFDGVLMGKFEDVTNSVREQTEVLYEEDREMFPQEALELGVIDRIAGAESPEPEAGHKYDHGAKLAQARARASLALNRQPPKGN